MKQLLLLLSISLVLVHSADEDENPGRVLTNAARDLIELPMQGQGQSRSSSGYQVERPSHDDLAISRLQSKTLESIDTLWTFVTDPQRLAIISSLPGGASKQLLARFSEYFLSDIFALEQQVEQTGVVTILKNMDLTRAQRRVWRDSWQALEKVRGFNIDM